MGDTYFTCPSCKKKIKVHAQIEMVCTVEEQSTYGSEHSCTSRGKIMNVFLMT